MGLRKTGLPQHFAAPAVKPGEIERWCEDCLCDVFGGETTMRNDVTAARMGIMGNGI